MFRCPASSSAATADPFMLEEDIVERAMLRDMAAWQKQCADEATQTAVETDDNVPNRAPERRQFKWGSCPACGRACTPHCYNSGRNVGEVFLVCNGWRRLSQSGQRTCRGRKRFDMSLFQTLPVAIKEKYSTTVLGCHSSETDADDGKKTGAPLLQCVLVRNSYA